MIRNFTKFCCYVLPILWWSCAPSRVVKPLEKGEKTASVNLGGPLIHFAGTAIPVPLTSVMFAKGVTTKTTAFGSLHLTSLAFGVFQTDIGVCTQLYKNDSKKFGITANPVLNLSIDRWEWKGKIWPELDINAYKQFGTKHFVYAGLTNWFEPSGVRPHNETQTQRLFVNPQLGYTLMRKHWNYTLEVKWLAPNRQNIPNVVDYIGINHKGAVGVYLNFTKKLKS